MARAPTFNLWPAITYGRMLVVGYTIDDLSFGMPNGDMTIVVAASGNLAFIPRRSGSGAGFGHGGLLRSETSEHAPSSARAMQNQSAERSYRSGYSRKLPRSSVTHCRTLYPGGTKPQSGALLPVDRPATLQSLFMGTTYAMFEVRARQWHCSEFLPGVRRAARAHLQALRDATSADSKVLSPMRPSNQFDTLDDTDRQI